MLRQILILACCASCAVVAACDTVGHRVGQSSSVRFGRVSGAEPVDLQSDAAKGAVIGGTIGLFGGRSSSSAFNAAHGAALGGAATAAMQGSRTGTAYTVDLPGGTTTRIVTDQREIRIGDCVAIEQGRSSANIRRVSDGYCDPSNEAAVRAVDSAVNADASACDRAKDELAGAKDADAVDLAARKVHLLCGG